MLQKMKMEKESMKLTERQDKILVKLLKEFDSTVRVAPMLHVESNLKKELDECSKEDFCNGLVGIRKRLEFCYINSLLNEEDVIILSMEFTDRVSIFYREFGLTYENEEYANVGVFAMALYYAFIRRYNAAMKTTRILMRMSNSDSIQRKANKLHFELEQILLDDIVKCNVYSSNGLLPTDFEKVRTVFSFVKEQENEEYASRLEMLYSTDVFMNDADIAIETFMHDILVFDVAVGGETEIFFTDSTKYVAKDILKNKENYLVKVVLKDREWEIIRK